MARSIVTVLVLALLSALPLRAQTHDTITYHGNWIIDVLDADGSVVNHRAFHNDVIDAPKVLSGMLAGTYQFNSFVIVADNIVNGNSGGSPCVSVNRDTYTVIDGCFVQPSNSPCNLGPGLTCFNTLSVDAPDTSITVHGTIKAANPGTINHVVLMGAVQEGNQALHFFSLSGTTLKDNSGSIASISVATGQTVKVSVTISFS